MPYGVVLKDERPTSNIERRTSNNDVAFSRRSQPTPPKWLRRPDRLLWRSLPAPQTRLPTPVTIHCLYVGMYGNGGQVILKSNEKINLALMLFNPL